jgi:hypothetical protein
MHSSTVNFPWSKVTLADMQNSNRQHVPILAIQMQKSAPQSAAQADTLGQIARACTAETRGTMESVCWLYSEGIGLAIVGHIERFAAL